MSKRLYVRFYALLTIYGLCLLAGIVIFIMSFVGNAELKYLGVSLMVSSLDLGFFCCTTGIIRLKKAYRVIIMIAMSIAVYAIIYFCMRNCPSATDLEYHYFQLGSFTSGFAIALSIIAGMLTKNTRIGFISIYPAIALSFLAGYYGAKVIYVLMIILVIGVVWFFLARGTDTYNSNKDYSNDDTSGYSSGSIGTSRNVYVHSETIVSAKCIKGPYWQPGLIDQDVIDVDIDVEFIFKNSQGDTIKKTNSYKRERVSLNFKPDAREAEYLFGYMLDDIVK